jgi:hypothetical protein
MYVKKMSEKRKLKYEGLFRACDDIEPGMGTAFVYNTKAEALSAKTALYNHLKISGLIVYRRIQKIGNDSTKFWLENTCKPEEIINTTSAMKTLKNTLKPHDSEFRIAIIDFLRDSKMLSIDQAAELNTFHRGIERGGNANTGRGFEKVKKMKPKPKHVRKSNMSEAIRQASERFPTPELPMENPISNPFEEE